jgi:integrase
MAQQLRQAGHTNLVVQFVERAAERNSEQLDAVVEAVDRICTGKFVVPARDESAITVREFGERWTGGELHRKYPDHVKRKVTSRTDRGRFERHIYPVVGGVPISDFTLDHALAVMSALPEDQASATRRQTAQLMHRLLSLAVFPARLVSTNPLPKGFLPSAKSEKAKQCLYPAEDAALLGCRQVEVGYRVLFGFMAREGTRRSEAKNLRWRDIDLDRGAVVLDSNKTNDPRSWALDSGVLHAMRAWWDLSGRPGLDESVFPVDTNRLAEVLRDALKAAGVERPALFEKSDTRLAIRAHDLRGTFVTAALANGKTEAWVADRTGHRSSQMINTYRRTARTYAELGLGELAAMVEAIPELRVPFEKAREKARATKTEAAKIANSLESFGGPSWTRTRSQWIKNAATYGA